jgi:hypothetical protein
LGHHEVGRVRVAVAQLPQIARVLATTVGEEPRPGKGGPAPKLLQQMERIQRLPRTNQRFVMEMLDTILQQAGVSASRLSRREMGTMRSADEARYVRLGHDHAWAGWAGIFLGPMSPTSQLAAIPSEPPSLACPICRAAAAEKGGPIPWVGQSEPVALLAQSLQMLDTTMLSDDTPSWAAWSAEGGVTRMCRDPRVRAGGARSRGQSRRAIAPGRGPFGREPPSCASATAK